MLLVKSLDDGSVYLEGYANRSIVDRGDDFIGKKAWQLNNYKKNPIVLFNHDHSKPVGKVLNVEANDDGLFIKGRISNSKDPEISRIRDLVKEGILNSLSVGMRVHEEERKGNVNHIKACELHEISIVAVPMNQDSQFTATAKSMNGSLTHVLATVSEQTGHKDVAKAYEKIDSDEFVTIEQASERLAELAAVAKEVAYKFLKLECDETPIEIKQWITKAEETEETEEKEPQENVLAIKVPKSAFADQDELMAWATESGWKADNVQETEEHYLLVQSEAEGETQEVDLGDGVLAILPKAEGEEDSETEDLRQQFESETAQAVNGEEGNPPSWVTDEEAWAKAKEMSQSALGEVSYAFVTWAYHKLVSGKSMDKDKGLLDDANPLTQPLDGKPNANIEINPGLDQAKQTNVLLSNVVSLLQQLVDKTGSVQVTEQPKVEVENETETEEESVKMISEWFTGINSRLKNLGL